MRLERKVAIVTGAGSGIGQASALKFAQEGASVVVADIQQPGIDETVRSIVSSGGAAIGVSADVTNSEAVRGMVESAIKAYGRLDIMFNNAGSSTRGTILETDEETFDRIFAVNVKGVFLGCKEAIPVMQAQGGGVILNMASMIGIVGGESNVVYPATKGAVIQLTRCLALDHAAEGIRVNCVCPGPTDTPMLHRISKLTGDPEAAFRSRIANIPLGRIGTQEEVANVASFLCSDEASFITGAAIVSDGGWTAR